MCNTTYSIHTCVYRISYVQPVTPLESPSPQKTIKLTSDNARNCFQVPKGKLSSLLLVLHYFVDSYLGVSQMGQLP